MTVAQLNETRVNVKAPTILRTVASLFHCNGVRSNDRLLAELSFSTEKLLLVSLPLDDALKGDVGSGGRLAGPRFGYFFGGHGIEAVR